MGLRFFPVVLIMLFATFTGTSAAEKPLLTLSKKTALERKTEIAGQVVTIPGYDYGIIELHNRLSTPVELSWNIHEDQNFVPVVRNAAGQVISNGSAFGFARAPSAELKKHTVPPGNDYTIEAHMLFETVPQEQLKPGTYFIRMQLRVGQSLWESNEIRVEWKEP
jgi:hypothetical protein